MSLRTLSRTLLGGLPQACRIAALACVALVAACGGNSNSTPGQASVRVLNLTADVANIDLFANDTALASTQGADAASADKAIDAGTYTLAVRRSGNATNLLSGSYALGSDQHYLAIVWGRETALRLSTLPEDADNAAIGVGVSRLRIFNATIDSGAVDVYLTTPTADIAETTPLVANSTAGTIGSYRDISAGTYRLRLTGAGDPADVRLDIPAVTLPALKHATLVVTAGASGVLVHGTQIEQRGALTTLRNTQARVRVVASVEGSGNVGATMGSRTLVGSLRSPTLGPYTLVDAGTAALTVRVNGTNISATSRTLTAGSDYTVLAYGSLAAPQVRVLSDDNRLPGTTGRARVRLVNGTQGGDPLTLSIDYQSIASDITAGAASSYFTVTSTAAGTNTQVDVTAPSAAAPLFSTTAANLQTSSVYTIYVLGGNAAPTGRIQKER
jgi:Domain of unknown function (DUF4397)